jgi:hypothetical protein
MYSTVAGADVIPRNDARDAIDRGPMDAPSFKGSLVISLSTSLGYFKKGSRPCPLLPSLHSLLDPLPKRTLIGVNFYHHNLTMMIVVIETTKIDFFLPSGCELGRPRRSLDRRAPGPARPK